MSVQKTSNIKGVVAWFANNSIAANFLMITIIIFGLFSAYNIKKTIFPDFKPYEISVSIEYPGADAKSIEKSILFKIEKAVKDIIGIKQVNSFASNGSARVSLSVSYDQDFNEIYEDVKNKIQRITNFPIKAKNLRINKVEFKPTLLSIAVFGDIDTLSLQRASEKLSDELMSLPWVGNVNLFKQGFEIVIEPRKSSLKEYGLTFDDVVFAINQESTDISMGHLTTNNGNISVKALGKLSTGFEYGNLIIKTNKDGSHLYLKDIAIIHDGFGQQSEGVSFFNGKNSLIMDVKATEKSNDIEVSNQIKAFLKNYNNQLPDTVKAAVWNDKSYYLKQRMDMMYNSMISGGFLVFIMLAIFLRISIAFWVAFGIPVAFLGAFALMPNPIMPLTVNLLSLFGFILVLGIVVDDAIIVGDSAYSYIQEYGYSANSVVRGVKRIMVPSVFGVLTTIAAFFPMLFMTGRMAPFFHAISLVVVLCLLFSLLESKLILPAHLAHMHSLKKNNKNGLLLNIQNKVNEWLAIFVERCYLPLLKKAINNSIVTLVVFAGIIVLTVCLLLSPFIKLSFMPSIPKDNIELTVELSDTLLAKERQTIISKIDESVKLINQEFFKSHNKNLIDNIIAFSYDQQKIDVYFEILKSEQRTITSKEIAKRMRDKIGKLSNVRRLVFDTDVNVGGSKPIYFNLNSKNSNQLARAADDLAQKLKQFDGVYEVENSYISENTSELAKSSISVNLNSIAQILGLSLSQIGNKIRQQLYGEDILYTQRDREEVNVIIRSPESDRNDLSDITQMQFQTKKGDSLYFSDIAEAKPISGNDFIRRRNGKRNIFVSANIDDKKMTSIEVLQKLDEDFFPEFFVKYPDVSSGLGGANLEEKETKGKMIKLTLISILLIYMLIAIPLRSYFQPLIIMGIIPFGLVGAIIGHLLYGEPFSAMSAFGLVALAGVLVNDSLVLVSFINESKREGMLIYDAILLAGKKRFRAIILTSSTTFMGLIPISLQTSAQAKFLSPMAISLSYGILFATIITLLLTPTLYIFFYNLLFWFKSKFSKKKTEVVINS